MVQQIPKPTQRFCCPFSTPCWRISSELWTFALCKCLGSWLLVSLTNYRYIGITLSVCSSMSLIVSAQYLLNRSTNFFFSIKLGMVVYYHEAMCLLENLVHCFQCQGHSEGVYNQNVTIFTISPKLLVRLQPNLV